MKLDTILCRRVPAPVGAPYRDALVPADDPSAERLAKIQLGEPVAIKIMRGRSLPQHRLFFAVLQHIAANSEWETSERLLVALKIRLGRYDLMRLPNGKSVPVPDSISFSAMTQDGFQRFFDEALRVICDEVLGGYDAAQLIAETQAAVGISPETLQSNTGRAA